MYKNYTLLTSNQNKYEEYLNFGLKEITIKKGKDIKEVEADDYTVAIYKAVEAGIYTITEDTSLYVEDLDIGIGVKWMMDQLSDIKKEKQATWKVLIGVNDGFEIKLYEGKTSGIIIPSRELNGFGFDSVFVPDSKTNNKTMQKLKQENNHSASARKKGIDNLLVGKYERKILIKHISNWNGEYQNEY